MEFLRDVLSGDKKALANDQVNMVSVPRFKEFNTAALTAKALSDDLVRQYIPDPAG
jgi:hypothetical protein